MLCWLLLGLLAHRLLLHGGAQLPLRLALVPLGWRLLVGVQVERQVGRLGVLCGHHQGGAQARARAGTGARRAGARGGAELGARHRKAGRRSNARLQGGRARHAAPNWANCARPQRTHYTHSLHNLSQPNGPRNKQPLLHTVSRGPHSLATTICTLPSAANSRPNSLSLALSRRLLHEPSSQMSGPKSLHCARRARRSLSLLKLTHLLTALLRRPVFFLCSGLFARSLRSADPQI